MSDDRSDEKVSEPKRKPALAPSSVAQVVAPVAYRVLHGSIVLGDDPAGGRKVANQGDTITMMPEEVEYLLSVGAIERI